MLAAFIAVSNARVAVSDEVDASLHTATASLDLTLELLRGRPDGEMDDAIRHWAAAYSGGRHLCVSVESRSGDDPFSRASFRCTLTDDLPGVPSWFARGTEITEPPVVRDLPMSTQDLRIYLVADPRDESREAWADVREQLLLMGVLALTVNICVFIAVSHGLRPLRRLMTAMDRIGRGDLHPDLPQSGAPEMQVLSEGLREMAARIDQGREQVRSLHLRNLDLQEDERRMVARELHDEIGQHVTAIEMETIRITRMAPEEQAQRDARLQQLRSSVSEIHRVSRRLVHRLRPPSIEALGLIAALEGLLDRWRNEHPDIELVAELAPEGDEVSTERGVHLYRIVQESLSNAARHSGARTVWVRLEVDGEQVRVQVTDDGRGFDSGGATRGFGLAGMRERVEALAGKFELRSKGGAGTIVEAVIPLRKGI